MRSAVPLARASKFCPAREQYWTCDRQAVTHNVRLRSGVRDSVGRMDDAVLVASASFSAASALKSLLDVCPSSDIRVK